MLNPFLFRELIANTAHISLVFRVASFNPKRFRLIFIGLKCADILNVYAKGLIKSGNVYFSDFGQVLHGVTFGWLGVGSRNASLPPKATFLQQMERWAV